MANDETNTVMLLSDFITTVLGSYPAGGVDLYFVSTSDSKGK